MTALILLATMLILWFMARIIYNKFWSYRLSATVNFRDDMAYEGEKTVLIEVITNDKPLPIPILEIDFHLNRNLRFTDSANSTVSDKLYRRDVFSMGGKKKITRQLELFCAKRGYFTTKNVGIMATDLFMTKKYLKTFSQVEEFYVYPRRIGTDKIAIPFNKIMGDVLSRNKLYDDPFEFGGIRDYMISDPMKYINWKASAKSLNLVVNLHDSSLSQKVTIILDTYDSSAPIDDELNEECIRVLSALSERIIRAGVSLSVIGNGFDILSHDVLCLNDIRGSDGILIKKTLSRLIWNDLETVSQVMSRIKVTDNTLYVLISKNVSDFTISELNRISFKSSALWILPFKDEQPMIQSRDFKVVYWRDDSPKI